MLDTNEQRLRHVYSELLINLKATEHLSNSGGLLIGNCNLDLGVNDVVVRIIPPDDDGEHAEAIILNSTYSNEEFEHYMGDRLADVSFYMFGRINMDIRTAQTVWKFFPQRYDEHNILIINRTQPKESICDSCGYNEGRYMQAGTECPSCGCKTWHVKKPWNPLEVKIFMQRRELRARAA